MVDWLRIVSVIVACLLPSLHACAADLDYLALVNRLQNPWKQVDRASKSIDDHRKKLISESAKGQRNAKRARDDDDMLRIISNELGTLDTGLRVLAYTFNLMNSFPTAATNSSANFYIVEICNSIGFGPNSDQYRDGPEAWHDAANETPSLAAAIRNAAAAYQVAGQTGIEICVDVHRHVGILFKSEEKSKNRH